MAREYGVLVQWNDERGFGFIQTKAQRRYFVHISQIRRMATRPRQGDVVSFEPTSDFRGRPQARAVSIAGANPVTPMRQSPGEAMPGHIFWRLPVAALCTGLLVFATLSGHAPAWLPLAYIVMGIVSFCLYRADKTFAETGQWRISEAMLLSIDLGFGVLGGLLAQAVFRHKTRKSSYVATTLLLAGVHSVWLIGLAGGWISEAELVALARELPW